MNGFSISTHPIETGRLWESLANPASGGYASFEGRVRDHNDGRRVRRLEYEAYEPLALREGGRIIAEAVARFGVTNAACMHRVGELGVGETAVWVGVSAEHRGEAFEACRYIIDAVKHRLPIWKKEHYADGNSGWVNCAHPAVDHPPFEHDYSRQAVLAGVGADGQARLKRAAVLVVGAGGLGVPVLQYLTAAGVGRIGVVDGDRIESSNLHRQPLYGVADIGRAKAEVAAERLRAINRDSVIEPVAEHATADNIDELVSRFDLVVDCTDNFRAAFLVNDAAVGAGKPAVFASVHQYEGQLQVYRPVPDWPCLRCLWPSAPRDGLVGDCSMSGVLGPVPATLGALQAMQALKMLLALDADEAPALVMIDLLSFETRRIVARRRTDCEHGRTGMNQAGDGAPLELEFETLDEALNSGFELVDIREPWELAMDPAGLALPIRLPLSDLVSGRAEFPVQGRFLVVCAHGVRSLSLTEHLRSLGQRDVFSLRGGLAELRI